MSLWRGKPAFFDFGLGALPVDAVEFPVSLLDKLGEECVADALGIEGCKGVVVLSGLVSGEEEHEFGQLVGLDFLGE